MVDLKQLHEAIVRGISGHINTNGRSFDVGFYETRKEVPWRPPYNGAVFLELDSFVVSEEFREDGTATATLELALIVIRGLGKRVACRALALEIAAFVKGNTWGVAWTNKAYDVEGAPDSHDFKAEDYEAYRVSWKQEVIIGRETIEDMACAEIFIGISPETVAEEQYLKVFPLEA